MPLDPNIRALQFAEQELKDHDRREAELRAEFKELKKTRAQKAARVQECIDVLCGKVTPDLFAQVDEEQTGIWAASPSSSARSAWCLASPANTSAAGPARSSAPRSATGCSGTSPASPSKTLTAWRPSD